MAEEVREVCKFLIVLAASCRMVRGSPQGYEAEARGQEEREGGGG